MTNQQKPLHTLVVGGSTNPQRFSYKAIRLLTGYGHPVVSIGLREGEVAGVRIQKDRPQFENIDTVTMYVGPGRQPDLYDYILGLQPRRIIFNPGTENTAFEKLAREKGIQTIHHCTLVMLNQGLF